MDHYTTIVKALQQLLRLTYLMSCSTVEFRIKPKDDLQYDPALFPAIMVKTKINEEEYFLEDLVLSISLYLNGEHMEESMIFYDKICKTKWRHIFEHFPESFTFNPINANVGKDLRIISALIIQVIFTLANCRDFDITTEYHSALKIKQEERIEKLSIETKRVSSAIKNAV